MGVEGRLIGVEGGKRSACYNRLDQKKWIELLELSECRAPTASCALRELTEIDSMSGGVPCAHTMPCKSTRSLQVWGGILNVNQVLDRQGE